MYDCKINALLKGVAPIFPLNFGNNNNINYFDVAFR